MKVKELIAELQKLSPDSEVICQRDSEGNGYSPLSGVDGNCVYLPDTTWSGKVFDIRRPADDHELEDEQWVKLKEQTPCAVLFPIV